MQLTNFLAFLFLPLAFAAPSAPAPQLPAPRGPHKYIGTFTTTLVDSSRNETLGGPSGAPRRIVAQAFYPISSSKAKSLSLSPYAPALTLSVLEAQYDVPNGTLSRLLTNSFVESTPQPKGKKLIPLLFSTGFGNVRALYTTFYEQLASEGYFVVALDHPYDASVVEFPGGGQPAYSTIPNVTVEVIETYLKVRAADARFVAGQLKKLCTAGVLDTDKMGMFGHSLGGATAAGAMVKPSPIKAGIDLDGTIFVYNTTSVTDDGKKFLMVGTSSHNSTTSDETSWGSFKNAQKGWVKEIAMQGFEHGTFADLGTVAVLLGLDKTLPPGTLEPVIGTVDVARARLIIGEYVKAFFEFALEGKKEGLLKGPNKKFPEAVFIQ
jgi:hypothetical protein